MTARAAFRQDDVSRACKGVKAAGLPANVSAVFDRHGKMRLRFRKVGYPSRYLKAAPGTKEFEAEYRKCIGYTNPLDRLLAGGAPEYVYFIASDGSAIKIGFARNPRARLKQLQTGHPDKLKLMVVVPGGARLEHAYHHLFAPHRIGGGEWFVGHDDVLTEVARLRRGEKPAPHVEAVP